LAGLLGEIHEESIPGNVSAKEKLEYLREEGKGVDIVMESLGAQYFTESFNALNREGSLVTFGSTSYVSPGLSINKIRLIWRYLTRPRIDPGTLTARNIQVAGFNLIHLTDKPDELRRELRDCIRCLNGDEVEGNSGDFPSLDSVTPPIIGETFDFRTGTIDALEKLKGGTTVGKVVLKTFQDE
jgi:NADPH:quinone reductase-like Zn-dependent oxidoreductase